MAEVWRGLRYAGRFISQFFFIFFHKKCNFFSAISYIYIGGHMMDFGYRFRGKWIPAILFVVGSFLLAIVRGLV